MTLETRKRPRRSKSSKKRGKGKGNKGIPPKKAPKVGEDDAEPPANYETKENETKEDVLGSFSVVYQAIIKSFPVCLWPTSSKHGQHSYTVSLGLNAVELLVFFLVLSRSFANIQIGIHCNLGAQAHRRSKVRGAAKAACLQTEGHCAWSIAERRTS